MAICANTAALREYESKQAALEIRGEIVDSLVDKALMGRIIDMLTRNDDLHIEAISETPPNDSNDRAARIAIINTCRLVDMGHKGLLSASYEAIGVAVFNRIIDHLSPAAREELSDEFSDEVWP